jgi:hypothetical protein
MSKREKKIMSLFKLAKEDEIKTEGILIDRELFLNTIKGLNKDKPVKVQPISVQV